MIIWSIFVTFRLRLFFLSFGHKMWTCLKLQTQDSPFLYLYLSKFIQIWTCMVPLSISKYLYLSLNWVGKDKCILSILLGYPFIEYNCTTRVNMSAYVLMCQWKYFFFCCAYEFPMKWEIMELKVSDLLAWNDSYV